MAFVPGLKSLSAAISKAEREGLTPMPLGGIYLEGETEGSINWMPDGKFVYRTPGNVQVIWGLSNAVRRAENDGFVPVTGKIRLYLDWEGVGEISSINGRYNYDTDDKKIAKIMHSR